jgi:hypothetical protein
MKITHNPTTKGIFPELRGNLGAIRYPCFGEIKYDGEATIIMYDETWPDKIITTNKYGTMRSDWSKLDEIVEIMESKRIKKATFLAELFYRKGELGDLYNLLSNKDNDTDLNLVIYDVAHIINDTEVNGTTTPLIDRKEILGELFEQSTFLIRPTVLNNKQDIEEMFKDATIMGYEGIVVKGFDGNLMSGPCSWVKIKKKDRTDYVVNVIDPTKERIEILAPLPKKLDSTNICILGTWYVPVGVKVMEKIKRTLNKGDMVTIEHQGILDSGSLRHPVFIGKAVKGE